MVILNFLCYLNLKGYFLMKKSLLSLLIVSPLFVSGCATILTDNVQKINVGTSNGEQIKVTIDGSTFDAPGIISVTKSDEKTKIISTNEESCAKQTALNREIEPVFFVNLLTGGAFGSTTDYASDSMWKYEDNVTVTCK